MAEATFSWFKLASFVGALVLAVLTFLLVGCGIYQIIGGMTTYGVACIAGGILSGIAAIGVYNNYQKQRG
jgi:hypothetical protein